MALDQEKLNQIAARGITTLARPFTPHASHWNKLACIGGWLLRTQTPRNSQAHGTTERYVREWLASQAAGGYVTFDAPTGAIV